MAQLKRIYNPTDNPLDVRSDPILNGDSLELRGYDLTQFAQKTCQPPQRVPIFLTRSALGVLRAITHPDIDYDLVVFVDADLYESGRNPASAAGVLPLAPMVKRFREQISEGTHREFYVFDSTPYTEQAPVVPTPSTRPAGDKFEQDAWPVLADVSKPLDDLHLKTYPDRLDPDEAMGLQDYEDWKSYGDRSERNRHYIIILYQDAKKPMVIKDPYVSVVDDGKVYYIDRLDTVSQDNFLLLAQLLTIQAVPQQTAPISSSVTVGGTR